MIVSDIFERLTVLDVPVLGPEQIEVPAQFQTGGDFWSEPEGGPAAQPASGLTAYLAANPGGFVQLTESREFSAGPTGEWRTVVNVIAGDRTTCQTLADRVEMALAGNWAIPGIYQTALPGLARSSAEGVYVCSQTFARVLIRNQ